MYLFYWQYRGIVRRLSSQTIFPLRIACRISPQKRDFFSQAWKGAVRPVVHVPSVADIVSGVTLSIRRDYPLFVDTILHILLIMVL